MIGHSNPDDPTSLFGPLVWLALPEYLGFDDHREIGRALAAWRFNLTRKDIRILECLAQGMTNSKIAQALSAADENTIKNRLKEIYKQPGVGNRAKAARIAVEFGFG